jgi:redox-sensitive bicupin YhaK (pirin superfamily)
MFDKRKADARGYAELDWLQSWYSFSFAGYYDPDYMGFGPLRVINEDIIAPGGGFATHPHRDMEIITYMLEGALEHEDSMGNGSVIRPGEVQRMSAGTGILHSEFNPSPDTPSHLLQIWILPDRSGHEPGYEQKDFSAERQRGLSCLIASSDGREGSLVINQDVNVYSLWLDGSEKAEHKSAAGRVTWVQMAKGSMEINGLKLGQGDGAAISEPVDINFEKAEGAEALIFDLPA